MVEMAQLPKLSGPTVSDDLLVLKRAGIFGDEKRGENHSTVRSRGADWAGAGLACPNAVASKRQARIERQRVRCVAGQRHSVSRRAVILFRGSVAGHPFQLHMPHH